MKKYAVAFPGQGSQYIGMGKKIYIHNKIARDIMSEASEVLGYDVCKLCFEGDIEEISRMDIVQPVILTTSVVAYQVFISEVDERPSFLLGHSLGEISALVCAGAIKFRDALKIACKRGQLMSSSIIEDGYMIAIMGLDEKRIEDECNAISQIGHIVEISNINSTEQIVISGNTKAVNEAVERLEQVGGRTMKVNTGNPFHCSLMQPVKSELLIELMKYQYAPLEIPVISNSDVLPYQKDKTISQYLSEQLVKIVRWKESISYLAEKEIFNIIEMRPQTIIRNLLMTNDLGVDVYSIDDESDYKHIKNITLSIVNGINNTRENKNNLIQSCIATMVSTKNRNWNDEVYLEKVVNCYNEIIQMQKNLIQDGMEPSYEDMKLALDLLMEVMEAKKTPIKEQEKYIKDILYQSGLFDLFENYLEEADK
jgi:[acyl-carrier-protein] S-malonyltransferase